MCCYMMLDSTRGEFLKTLGLSALEEVVASIVSFHFMSKIRFSFGTVRLSVS